jgi:hypothetical protein
MPARRPRTWRSVAAGQAGLIARRQLTRLGYDDRYVDRQVSAERWQLISEVVVATTTGVLTREQLMWAGVLHAGSRSAIGGLTALEHRGLLHWHRDEITVLLPKSRNLGPVEGIRFVQTRRPIGLYATGRLPVWRTEPAALLFSAYTPSARTAQGLLAAVVQQRLTTPARLLAELPRMHPLRRSRAFRATLEGVAEGAHSLAELGVARMCLNEGLPMPDRQVRRRDASGRVRFTDAQWRLPDGRVVILEVEGGFHMEVSHWEADIARERDLVATGAVVLRCTDREIRDAPATVAASLRAVGVGRSSA